MDTFIFYQSIFENSGNLESILKLPYPLFKDIIVAQVEQKKKEKDELERRTQNNKVKIR